MNKIPAYLNFLFEFYNLQLLPISVFLADFAPVFHKALAQSLCFLVPVVVNNLWFLHRGNVQTQSLQLSPEHYSVILQRHLMQIKSFCCQTVINV